MQERAEGNSGLWGRRYGLTMITVPDPIRDLVPHPAASRGPGSGPGIGQYPYRSSIMISRLPTALAGLTTPWVSICSTSRAALL